MLLTTLFFTFYSSDDVLEKRILEHDEWNSFHSNRKQNKKTETTQKAPVILAKAPIIQKTEAKQAVLNTVQSKPTLPKRPKACIVILVRNSELEGLKKTLAIFERQFNAKYQYPYIFLNNEAFSEEFRRGIIEPLTNKTNVKFGLIPKEHWSYPDFISTKKAAETRIRMKDIIYGSSESYRFMCHYQSGFFFRHPLLMEYDYYWRVEPDTKLLCEVPYDPFVMMQEKKLKYGFTVAIGEYPKTVEGLWDATMRFVHLRRRSDPSFNPSLLNFFATEDQSDYNMRHFWSNFEIGDLNFFRSKDYIDYFEYLDITGGFFYSRWGDAPVHSLGVGLFLKKEEVHFFDDIGYFHNPLKHCPPEPFHSQRKCDCERKDSADFLRGWSCTEEWRTYKPAPFF
jgi:alpha 1,2-mannosyltransferase